MKLLLALLAVGGVAVAGNEPTADPVRHEVAQDSVGKAIFTGKGLCAACHGPDAKGTALAPNLTDDEWLHADGTLEKLTADGGTLDQLVALGATLEAIAPKLAELGVVIPELHASVNTLSDAVGPLSELAGRLPRARRRTALEA